MEVSFDKIEEFTCRCCLRVSSDPMDNIFDHVTHSMLIYEILGILLPLTFAADDGLTQSICENCKANAVEAYCFRIECVASDEMLRFDKDQENHATDQETHATDQETEVTLIEEFETIETVTKEEEDYVMFDDQGDFPTCEFCQAMFNSHSELEAHIEICQMVDEDEAVAETFIGFLCTVCNLVCDNQYDLNEHMNKHRAGSSKRPTRPHVCTFCSKRFETPSKLTRHHLVHRDELQLSNLPERPSANYKYECDMCGKRVESPSKLTRHMRVHQKNADLSIGINQHRPNSCPDCDMKFWDVVRLERHRFIHSETFKQCEIYYPDGHDFTCVLCLDKIPNYEDCIRHMKDHRLEFAKDQEIICQLCGKSYPNLLNVIRHSKSHAENATHECIHCKKRFGMSDEFIEHMLRHGSFKPYVCEIPSCGKSFFKPHKLKQHMATHMGGNPKPFVCSVCGIGFADADYLKRHMIRHSGIKNHACTVCAARFSFKGVLNRHMKSHAAKTFSCEICSSTFALNSSLKLHMKSHKNEREHSCDACPKNFITKGQLKRHKLSHSGFKPYQCPYNCGKAYSQSNDLNVHLKAHLGPKIYQCQVDDCHETFEKLRELKAHRNIHEPSEILIHEEIVSS